MVYQQLVSPDKQPTSLGFVRLVFTPKIVANLFSPGYTKYMSIFRTTLYSAQDPQAGVGAPLQQTVTINNDVSYTSAVTVPLTTLGQSLTTLAGVPAAANVVDALIITNIEASSVTETITLNLGTNTVVLKAGAQFMLSGLGANGVAVGAWTLLRSVTSSTTPVVRIEFAV